MRPDRRALVTGASGFIGAHLCRRLRRDGADVYAVSRSTTSSELEDLNWMHADLGSVDAVREVLGAARPSVIFHLASHVSGSRDLDAVLPTFHDNLTTTVNLLTVATEIRCERIVLAGSLEEQNPGAVPGSPYAAAKFAASSYARMFDALYGTPVVIARLFMVYGPGQRDLRKLVPYSTLSLLRREAPQVTSGERPVDWIYIDDVIDGLLAAAETDGLAGQTVDVGSGELATVRDVVELLNRLTGSRVTLEFGQLPDRAMERVRAADVERTAEQMGWRPTVSLEEGLRRTVQWYADRR
ncbi:MAG TPA: SDR family NAD(P)-dependent oxidoreductase [Gammaproteobacteria bacterium]|nr:SDR family NAD(P)-dependent oxidoreductase [Gammaproteobacteria bacterium]